MNGYINVLNWFQNLGSEFKYSAFAIDWACKYNKINVLNWFHNSGYKFKYSDLAINYASEKGNIRIM